MTNLIPSHTVHLHSEGNGFARDIPQVILTRGILLVRIFRSDKHSRRIRYRKTQIL